MFKKYMKQSPKKYRKSNI
ncbi:hypothetical protein ABW365_05845 [Enterococcus avium]